MVLSLTDDESKGSEKIWKEFGFFKDQRVELTISKANFPENTLVYINQGSLSVVKGVEEAIYLDFVILGQIMPISNPDRSLILITMCVKITRSLSTVLFIINQLEYMVLLLKNLAKSPFEAILVNVFFPTDSLKKIVLYFFHQ